MRSLRQCNEMKNKMDSLNVLVLLFIVGLNSNARNCSIVFELTRVGLASARFRSSNHARFGLDQQEACHQTLQHTL